MLNLTNLATAHERIAVANTYINSHQNLSQSETEQIANQILWGAGNFDEPDAMSKTAYAALYDLPWRWGNNSIVPLSLEGLIDAADMEGSIDHLNLIPLNAAAPPPTKRRHTSPDTLKSASRDPDLSLSLLEERQHIYDQLADNPQDYNLKHKAHQLSIQLYQLCGDSHFESENTLKWGPISTSVPELLVRPLAHQVNVGIDPIFGASDIYNFEELIEAYAGDSLFEWAQQLSPSNQLLLKNRLGSYKKECEQAHKEQRLVDLRSPQQVERILYSGRDVWENSIMGDIIWVLVEKALRPKQHIIFDMKIAGASNADIGEALKKAGLGTRENYISTIWRQQIPIEIAATALDLEEQLNNIWDAAAWKRCRECGQYKMRTTHNFVKRKQCTDGLAGICKECDKKKREIKKIIGGTL